MSTLKVSNINNPSASSGGIGIDSSGSLSGALPYPNRNLIYNGAMQVHQRGTSATSITTAGYYTADRWQVYNDSLGTWTQTVESDAPTGSGFKKSLKMLVTTADSSPGAGDHLRVNQILEGQDVQKILKGTPNAKELSLSFWVKSNLTGAYTVWIYDGDNNRSVSTQYTINSSATWERKTLTIPADTTGALDNDNAASLFVSFWLGSGTNFTSGNLQTSWDTFTSADTAPGQTNLAANTNNYWQITGVQLETGPVATEFEFEPYGVTLAKCQRYWEQSYNIGTAAGTDTTQGTQQGLNGNDGNQINGIRWQTPKRTTPTVIIYAKNGTVASLTDTNGNLGPNSGSWSALDVNQFGFRCVVGTGGLTTSRAYYYHYTANAEL